MISARTLFLPAAASLLLLPSLAWATPVATIVPYATRATVDTDGDLTPDIFDNAPGLANDQQDADADGIGDVIDPTPVNSNPALGDPGLGLFSPTPITAGSHLSILYTMTLATPPGSWGHIDLDLGGDGILDATYFGPLDAGINTIDIAPSLYTDAFWNLNAPGTYELHARAFGPGMSSQNDSIITNVVVLVPEPASLLLLSPLLLLARRRKSA